MDLYTCPAGETALIKHLAVCNNAALGGLMTIRLDGMTGSTNIYLATIPAGGQAQLTPAFIVLQPGEVLRAVSSVASQIVTGYGAELEGVAD